MHHCSVPSVVRAVWGGEGDGWKGGWVGVGVCLGDRSQRFTGEKGKVRAKLPTLALCIVHCGLHEIQSPDPKYCVRNARLLAPKTCDGTVCYADSSCHCISTIGHQAHLAAYLPTTKTGLLPFFAPPAAAVGLACSRAWTVSLYADV